MADVAPLTRALHRVVDAGHGVILIKHSLDVIADADQPIDLRPEGDDSSGHGWSLRRRNGCRRVTVLPVLQPALVAAPGSPGV